MKINIHHVILCSAVVGVTLHTEDANAARVCRAKITLPAPDVGTCDVDSTNPKMGNPFAYIDPTQGCDFSFSLPGLPSLSLDGLQGMLCNQIQDIGQTAIDDALNPILDKLPSDLNLDMNGMMKNIFDDQIKLQDEFCPVYSKSGKLMSYECAGRNPNSDDGLPDWAVEIRDPEDEGRDCYEMGGYTYCTDPEDSNNKPNPTPDPVPDTSLPYDPDKDTDLPLCRDLTDFFDRDGNLIPCRNTDNSNSNRPVVETPPEFETSETAPKSKSNSGLVKPTWDTKKGW